MDKKKYNFDELIDRRKHHSKKWTDWSALGLETDESILPFWIADMDFKCEERILQELHKTVDFGVLGYDAPPKDFYEGFIDWQKRKNSWEVKKEWFVPTPGIVPGISNAIVSLTEKNDKILIQPPIYYPFFTSIEMNKRELVENTLIIGENRFEIDFDDLEKKAKDSKMMILCNPHNPVGRVYTKEELLKIGDICLRNKVILISDEIHSDLLMKNQKHISIASLSKELADITITMTAPSKTFNIAGLAQSVAIISNPHLRQKFIDGMAGLGCMHMAAFGISGFKAAYKYGEEWLKEVLIYIEDNVDYVMDYIKNNLPQLKTFKPEGTYLMWIDFSAVSKDPKEIDDFLINKAKILLDPGVVFRGGGDCYYRFNIASPRSVIKDAMQRIEKAFSMLKK